MRKIILRMNEQYPYDIIKKLVDTKASAALKLVCSLRSINRLIFKYKAEGGFIHKDRKRKLNSSLSSRQMK